MPDAPPPGPPRSRHRTWVVASAGLAGAALVGAGAWGWVGSRPALPQAGPPPALARGPVPVTQTPAPSPTAEPTTTMPPPAPFTVPVTAVSMPALRVAAPAVAVTESTSGALGVPPDPSTVGWWVPAPGVLVIDGHVDAEATGPGALFHLQDSKPGDAVHLASSAGPATTWVVQGVRTYTKGQLPDALLTGPGPRLVLVTCGGPSTGPPTTISTTSSSTPPGAGPAGGHHHHVTPGCRLNGRRPEPCGPGLLAQRCVDPICSVTGAVRAAGP